LNLLKSYKIHRDWTDHASNSKEGNKYGDEEQAHFSADSAASIRSCSTRTWLSSGFLCM